MSLRLICGRAGTGKSDFCFEEIKKNISNKEKIYMITPEQYSFTAEKKLLEKIETGATTNAEVLTFARMAYRVLSEVGGITKLSLSKAGRAMLIYDILEKEKTNLTFLGKSNKNIELMETQLTELKKHSVSLDMLDNVINNIEDRYLEEKLKDIIHIYGLYEEKLKGKYIEENDRLEILANKLEESNLFENCIFYIDEFSGFTKQEYKIIEKLLKVAKEVNITITTDNLDLNTNMETDLFYESKKTADKLLYIARSNEIKCEKTIFMDEFHRFKNKELIHLEQNIQSVPYKKYEQNIENLSIFLAKNPYSEVEYVAKEIVKLVKYNNYRYRDIIVITNEIENYASLAKAIFGAYDIPVFIDEKKELSQNEFAKYILALLEVFSSNWSYEAVIQYLKIGFTDIEKEEIYEFENYCKKWGIKGSKWYKGNWNFGEQEEDKKEKAERMLKIRERVITPLLKLKENLVGSKKVEQINLEIYNFLVENKIQEKIKEKQINLEEQGKIELAKEEELAWNIVMQVLDEIETLFSEDNISFEKYRELLKIGLEQVGLGKIPQTQDQVIIGSLDRTKASNLKTIFIIGGV